MTIIEAIKSGKRFKRPIWGKEYFTIEEIIRDCIELEAEDFTATDYIVDEPKPNMRVFCVIGHSQHYKTGSLHFLDANKVQLNPEIFADVTEKFKELLK